VRADQRRILTCFLEYSQDFVTVHDVLTERRDGEWQQRVSSYPKLRLAPEWLASKLVAHGLEIRRGATQSGMVRIIGVKT